MREPRWTRGRRLLVSVLSLVLVAGGGVAIWQRARTHSGGPLYFGDDRTRTGINISGPTAQITFGNVTATNTAPKDVIITSVELLPVDQPEARVFDIRLLDTTRHSGAIIGVDRTYQPPPESVPAIGAVLHPGDVAAGRGAYQFIFGIEVDQDVRTDYDAVRVRYTVGGVRYVITAPHGLSICTTASVEEFRCISAR